MAVALDLIDNLEINEIMKISGFLEEKTLEELSISLKNKNVIRAGEIVDSIEILDSRNFIRQISETLPSLNLDPESIYKLRAFIGEIDYRISQGADEKIQISALLAMISSALSILILLPMFSSNHILPPPAPQQKLSLPWRSSS